VTGGRFGPAAEASGPDHSEPSTFGSSSRSDEAPAARLASEGTHFTRAYAPATHTDYSDISVHTSQYPLRSSRHFYCTATDPAPRKTIGTWLAESGYASALFSSQNLQWAGMANVLDSPGLDVFFDAASRAVHANDSHGVLVDAVGTGGTHDDEETTDAAIEWILDERYRC